MAESAKSGGIGSPLGPWSSGMTLLVSSTSMHPSAQVQNPIGCRGAHSAEPLNFTRHLVLTGGDVPFLAEGEKQLAELPNLVVEGSKVHQAPSPKSSAPHVTQEPCAKPSEAPREAKGGKSCVREAASEHFHHAPRRRLTNDESFSRRKKVSTLSVSGVAFEQLNRATHQKITNDERCAREAPSFFFALLFEM